MPIQYIDKEVPPKAPVVKKPTTPAPIKPPTTVTPPTYAPIVTAPVKTDQTKANEAYNLAKSQLLANKNNTIKNATENYNLTQKQTTELSDLSKQNAVKLASQSYVGKRQSERVLSNQMAQSGLASSGYTGLADKQVTGVYKKNQEGISSKLREDIAGYQRSLEGAKLNFDQQVRSANLSYNNQIQDANKTNANYQDQVKQSAEFGKIVNEAMTGRYSQQDFYNYLKNYGADEATIAKYMLQYEEEWAKRQIQ